MTATLSRGWAPLRGVIIGRDKYVDLPIEELYGLDSDPREERNQATANRPRVEILLNALRGFNTAPPALPGEETSAVRDRLRALGYVGGSPAAPRDRYGEADDPKRLIEIDALLHRAGDSYQKGQPEEAAKLFQRGHRATARHRGRVSLSRIRLLAGGSPGGSNTDARNSAQERHHAPRRPREARSLSVGDRQRRARDSPARRTGRRRHRGFERPGNRLRTGQPRRGCNQEPSSMCSRSIRPMAWGGRTSAPCSCGQETVAPPRNRCDVRSPSTTPSLAHTPLSASSFRRPGASQMPSPPGSVRWR